MSSTMIICLHETAVIKLFLLIENMNHFPRSYQLQFNTPLLDTYGVVCIYGKIYICDQKFVGYNWRLAIGGCCESCGTVILSQKSLLLLKSLYIDQGIQI
jgi:hypothetical protein